MQLLYDRYQRRINYLRLSVTDRCNFRCIYCMPAGGIEKCSHDDVLSYENFFTIAQAAIELGVEKIRITGGEPLIRKGILSFISRLRALPALKQLVITTNGYNLSHMAEPLSSIGIDQLNISLDTLNARRFEKISRIGTLAPVWNGIMKAHALAIPIKINMVVMRGINDDEIETFAALSLRYNWSMRFIEYMPNADGSREERGLSADEIYTRIKAKFPLQKVDRYSLSGPATNYRIPGAAGTIGIISALSCSFCSSCNRIRVTSTGKMRNCLYSDAETDLRPYLNSADIPGLKQAITANVYDKSLHHSVHWDDKVIPPLHMSRVGG